ncbi:MAG: serine hydrolase domain-containing protein [Cellvibrionaceae bacterium]
MKKNTSIFSIAIQSFLFLTSLSVLSSGSFAQQSASGPRPAAGALRPAPKLVTDRHAAARSAGYRALHLCTGTFASGLSDEMVQKTMSGRASDGMATVIDREKKLVSVKFSDDMEPRIAAWRPALGCTQLPIGASVELVDKLPRMSKRITTPNLDDEPWPMGDVNAISKLTTQKEQAVSKILDEAFKNQSGVYSGNTWGVVVVKDGKIVAERYANGWNQHTSSRTNSMCKSISASLVGVGVQKGMLDIHQKAPLKAWQTPGDPRGEISINNLLQMASGLYTEAGRNPQGEIYGSGAPASEVSMWNVIDSKPGERFVYAGSDTILATRALREALGNDKKWMSYPHKEFLWKIGMTRTILEGDWRGDFNTSGQCWSTARDFGRFGLLYLAKGKWKGEQILPDNWADYVSTLAKAQPKSFGTPGRAGYGAQFWIYDGMEGLPKKAYSPGGALGQYAMIIPSENLVVVRRGLDRGKGFNIAKFSADVVNALK